MDPMGLVTGAQSRQAQEPGDDRGAPLRCRDDLVVGFGWTVDGTSGHSVALGSVRLIM